MATRWIVDTDGRGACAVAMEESGQIFTEFGPATREQCERRIQQLRDQDVKRTRKSRVERGRALADHNRARRKAVVVEEPPAPEPVPEPEVKAPAPDQKNSLDLYAQGFYREPCRKCGKGIERTGARGRAPTIHKEGCP